jgi:hypothetical protein
MAEPTYPDYTALAEQVRKEAAGASIDYTALAEGVRKPPQSIPDKARGAGPEVLSQLGNAAKGAWNMGKTLVQAHPFNPNEAQQLEARKTLGTTAKEMVMRPIREMGGIPQPEEQGKPYTPFPFAERPFAAVGTALGADPARARELTAQGNTSGAWAAKLTGPGVSLATGKALNRVGGSRLPTPNMRAARLTYAAGSEPKIFEAFQSVLPELDKTAQATVPRPADLHPRVAWYSGSAPKDAVHDMPGLINATLGRLESDFQSILRPRRAERVRPQSVADRIRASITDEEREFNGGKVARAIEDEAKTYEQDYSLGALNDRRMKLFRKKQSPMTERIAERNDWERRVDDVAESALRKFIYDTLDQGPRTTTTTYGPAATPAPTGAPALGPTQALVPRRTDVSRPLPPGRTPPDVINMEQIGQSVESQPLQPGTIQYIKAQEAALMTLKDQLESQAYRLTANEARLTGAPLSEKLREKFTMYVHKNPAVIAHPMRGNRMIDPKKAASSVRGAFSRTPNFPTVGTGLAVGTTQNERR